jgi:hypothetical protein
VAEIHRFYCTTCAQDRIIEINDDGCLGVSTGSEFLKGQLVPNGPIEDIEIGCRECTDELVKEQTALNNRQKPGSPR